MVDGSEAVHSAGDSLADDQTRRSCLRMFGTRTGSSPALSSACFNSFSIFERRGLQREVLDGVFAFLWCKAMSGHEQFLNGLPDRHVVADEKNAWHGQVGRDPGVGGRRNRLAIVRQQNQTVSGRPLEDYRIGRRRQTNIANVDKFQCRIAPGQTVHDVLIEVLVDQKRVHWINPFALARATSSSLLGPGRCDASMLQRTAPACSSHCRR